MIRATAQELQIELESTLAKEENRARWNGCMGLQCYLYLLFGDILEQGGEMGYLERERVGCFCLLDINIICTWEIFERKGEQD